MNYNNIHNQLCRSWPFLKKRQYTMERNGNHKKVNEIIILDEIRIQ